MCNKIKGTCVYFLGALIISNKWYDFVTVNRYLFRNFLALFSGITAVFLGYCCLCRCVLICGRSMYEELVYLRGIGGTFTALFLVEKYIEIPWGRKRFYWGLLGIGLLLYLIALFVHTNPQYFISFNSVS